MAFKKFVVCMANEPPGQPHVFGIGGPLIAVFALAFRVSLAWEWISVGCLAVITLILLHRIIKGREEKTCQVTATVYPVGVQLARMQRQRPVGPPLLIPRDLILDVIVNEVILAHKVVSVVVFRVLKKDAISTQSTKDATKPSMSSLLRQGCIHLVPAFPGVEMSFADCQRMRRELSTCLGLL